MVIDELPLGPPSLVGYRNLSDDVAFEQKLVRRCLVFRKIEFPKTVGEGGDIAYWATHKVTREVDFVDTRAIERTPARFG